MSLLIPDIIAKRASLTPDATAFRDLALGTSLNYRDLDLRAAKAAALLSSLSVAAGDRVAILSRNRIEFFELLFACGKLGAILVPLNWRMPAPELLPLIQDAEPKVLLHGSGETDTAAAILRPGVKSIALDDAGNSGYACLRERNIPLTGRSHWPADECWYLLYTSGTTGRPKAVMQTVGMAIANYINIRQAMAISATDVTLNYLPLFHTAGINLVTLPTLLEGGEVLLLPDFDMERVIALLSDGALDTFFGVPAVYQKLSLDPRFDSLNLSQVRNWGCGGAPMPPVLLERYIERGARVCSGMGMTETGPTVFLMDPQNVVTKAGSVGKPQMMSSVRIVDTEGQDVVDGEPGELWFAGPGITPGYWRRDDATAEVITGDGWLKSGDIGRRDEDGYYYIVGRIKDMYISGGENVYAAEVENVLAAHPDILEAAVVAMPDERWGEVGCAYLLSRSEHAIPPATELTRYCRQFLAPFKVPKSFKTVADFPRSAAGKVQKHLLTGSK